jgi:hypothetical protein
MRNRPGWYTDEHDNQWNRVKAAFRNDWEQTKHDFGSDKARDLNQDAGDTVRQAMGKEDTFDAHEPAFRFGHAAQRQYRSQYPTWNNDLESRLRQDYGDGFDRDSRDIRRAYEYRYATTGDTTGARDTMRDSQ